MDGRDRIATAELPASAGEPSPWRPLRRPLFRALWIATIGMVAAGRDPIVTHYLAPDPRG